MLSVRLICVGKLGEKFWADAVKEYTKRLGAIVNQRSSSCPSSVCRRRPLRARSRRRWKGSRAHRSKLLPGASVIAMCVEGKRCPLSSWRTISGKLTVSGTSKISVIIGSSCGLSERVKKKAALRLSMSPMTFPHHLARVMVLEQIYRALNIAAGGKYHK
ncbi:MAG: 23S rRNA (pseudouridine(1915)-N(3))-methyltransferase RlmH [Butyricicoccaceae bacterium]